MWRCGRRSQYLRTSTLQSLTRCCLRCSSSRAEDASSLVDFSRLPSACVAGPASFGISIVRNFVASQSEQDSLLAECSERLSRRRFERSHWDGVITGFREDSVPLANAGPALRTAVARAWAYFPPAGGAPLPFAHLLELEPAGYISRHVDSVKFSGGVVAGICLASDAVMRLYPVADGSDGNESGSGGTSSGVGGESSSEGEPGTVDLLLERGCLYVMSGECRYHWAHAVLKGTTSFRGKPVARGRRVSIILRDELLPNAAASVPFRGSLAEEVLRVKA